ncbi:hypothetical protein [Scopulibacillus cellulosilyticus]|uniref:DUF4129 domain-containing protein n=1 Tax=Scopulibacillus cellulosilyticus TaxID=2665665 RepID=A0ABW2PWE8_9BACL
MRNNQSVFLWAAVIFEWIFIYTLFVPFYSGHWQLFLPLLILAVIYAILFTLVRKKFPSVSMAVYFGIALVPMIVGYVIFDFHLLLTLIIGVLFYFRSIRLFAEKTSASIWQLFFGYTVLAIFYYLFIHFLVQGAFHHRFVFIILLAFQFLTTTLIIACQNQMSGMSKGLPLFMLGFFFVALAAAGLVLVLKTVLIAVIQFLVKGIAFLIIEGTSVLFNWLVTPFVSKEKEERLKQVLHVSDNPMLIKRYVIAYHPPSYLSWMIIGVLIALAIIIMLFLRKRKLLLDNGQMNAHSHLIGDTINIDVKKRSINRKRRHHPPKDPVRLGMYKMQNFARKIGLGRYSHESLDEWLSRTGLLRSSGSVKDFYDKTRYGGKELTKEELVDYNATLKQMKEDFKNQINIETNHVNGNK